MRAPLSWIRDFTPVEASTDELVAALNQVGLEVEGVEEPGRDVRGVVAARVLDVVEHPNADKLTLVDVDFGNGSTRVVVTTVATGASTAVASFAGEGVDLDFALDGSALYWIGPPADAASATGAKVLYKYAFGTGVRSVVTTSPSTSGRMISTVPSRTTNRRMPLRPRRESGIGAEASRITSSSSSIRTVPTGSGR